MLAMSAGFPSFSSKIPGVQLWVLHSSDGGPLEESFEESTNEFIQYCNGTRSIYVSSFVSPIRCTSEAIGGGAYRIHLSATDRRLSGLVVVSKNPLPNRAKSLPITAEESERLRKAEGALMSTLSSDAMRSYKESSADIDATAYAKILREIKSKATFRKYGGARYKISSPDGLIFISAIGLFPNGLGWDIKNVVFREIDGKLQVIGDFLGCIEGFRDLTASGTPEVLTRLCENDEGTDDTFWSLTLSVHRVVTRSQ
jgi:hypothetical protein